jgi:hypothetical protein
MKYLVSKILLLSFCIQSVAQEVDYIYSDYEMKDGTIYTGYISSQSFTDKTITLTTISALKVMDEVDAKINSTFSITPISTLDGKMQNWLNSHSYILPDSNNKSTVVLTVIEDRKNQRKYDDVILVQRGEKVKFIACENEKVKVNVNEIVKFTKSARPSRISSGLNECFSTRKYGNDITGQVVCQNMKEGTICILGDEGYQFNIKTADIISRSEILIDPELPYNEQCPFIETVKTKNGSYSGFISKQVFGTKDMPGYLLVQTSLNHVDRVEYADIIEIQRQPNERYKPIILPNISENEYYVCNKFAYPCVLNRIQSKDEDTYYVYENNDSTRTHIVLNINNIKSGVYVQIKTNPLNKNLIFVPLKNVYSNSIVSLKYKAKYYFNLDDEIFPKKCETKHGIDTFVYEIEQKKGHYVLFRKDKHEAVWIEIK